jgi:hypothetical protein
LHVDGDLELDEACDIMDENDKNFEKFEGNIESVELINDRERI